MHKNDITLMENLAKVTLNVAENEKWSATDVTRMLATMALQAAQHMRAVDGSDSLRENGVYNVEWVDANTVRLTPHH